MGQRIAVTSFSWLIYMGCDQCQNSVYQNSREVHAFCNRGDTVRNGVYIIGGILFIIGGILCLQFS